MIKANVILDHYKWKNKIKSPNKYFKKKINKLNKIGLFKKRKHEFSVLLTNNRKMKNLNFKFRKKNKPTDVLSFPSHNVEKKSIYIGDIILNYYKISKTNFKRDFNKLWIHGFLHLLGYKHFKNKDFYQMKKMEKIISL